MTQPLQNRPNTLHVMHSWGGGLSKWVNDFCQYDTASNSFQLQSVGRVGVPGIELHLFSVAPAAVATQESLIFLKKWALSKPITSTTIYSLEYQVILEEIFEVFKIDSVIVSSFIGHSLDILSVGTLPKIIVCHDYYPFCPAINIYFEETCMSCRSNRLKECFSHNAFNRFFPLATAEDWVSIRRSYVDLVTRYNIPLVVPSASVKKHLQGLSSRLQQANFVEISHGVEALSLAAPADQRFSAALNDASAGSARSRPRIVILGSIDYQKGFHLIQEVYPQLTRFSDLYFVGSGEKGEIFAKQKGVHVIKEYTHQDLPAIFKEVAPDLALLLSVWPETYSYTLSELFMLKVPVVATHLGSFADRIDEGATGFLVEPTADQLLVKVKDLLYGHRAKLDSVVETLTQMSHRTIPEMISDYSALIAIQPTQQSSDIYTFTESVLLSRQLSLDINKLDRKKSAWKFKRKNTFSERVPITARFTLLNSIKNRFPKTWERIKAPIIRIYTRITY